MALGSMASARLAPPAASRARSPSVPRAFGERVSLDMASPGSHALRPCRIRGYAPKLELPGAQTDLRSDVLVQPEEVRRVVLAFERPEPLVLGLTVGRPHSVLPLVPEKVHIDTARGKRTHRLPQLPGPRDARGRASRLGPDGVDVHRMGCPPVLEGRSLGILSTDGAA